MGRLDGKIAVVTGAARGQGRSHAIRFAREGADLILVDICADVPPAGGQATEQDLRDTTDAIEALDRRVVTAIADVRDLKQLRELVDAAVAQLGGLDILVANAGIATAQPWDQVTVDLWQATIDVDLAGVWHACAVAAPHLIDRGGGAMILTSSTAGIIGVPFLVPYVAAKHGVVGVMKVLANELGTHNVRVNTIHPGGVDTPMLAAVTERLPALLAARPDLTGLFATALPHDTVAPGDVTDAVVFLASDEARYITGLQMTVDLGNAIR